MSSVSNGNVAPVAFFLLRVDDEPRVLLARADSQHTDPRRHGPRSYAGERPELSQILNEHLLLEYAFRQGKGPESKLVF